MFLISSMGRVVVRLVLVPVIQIARRIARHIDEQEREELLKSLKYRGKDITICSPVIINGAEHVEIGDQVSIAPFVHMWGGGGITIGNRVMIASHTAITSLTHDYTKKDMHASLVKGSVFIEDDVWIGAHAVIMPGTRIGRGAVIAAGAIVTKDVADYSVVMGVPAKHEVFRKIGE